VKQVILVDTETKVQTNLMNQSYSFETVGSSTNTSSRFYVLLSGEEANGFNFVGKDNIQISTSGNKVYLSGLKGEAHVRMYDAVGKLIYQFSEVRNENPIDVNVPGLYIVDISTASQKARVKLLVNNK